MEKIAEICCGSLQDGFNAYQGGASRIELNSALALGGLTPSLAALKILKEKTSLEIICMVRPRAGGFCYEEKEAEQMFEDARLFLENGADGIAFGFLDASGELDESKIYQMIELIHHYGKTAVFHRAIDVANDYEKAIEQLMKLGIDRILTSGQQANVIEGAAALKRIQQRFGQKIQILAGAGLNENNVQEFMEKTGICQVHSSCKGYQSDSTTKHKAVSFAYLAMPHEKDYDVTDIEKVKRFVENAQN